MFTWDASMDGSTAISRLSDDVCVCIAIAYRAAGARREKPSEYWDKEARSPSGAGTSAACRY